MENKIGNIKGLILSSCGLFPELSFKSFANEGLFLSDFELLARARKSVSGNSINSLLCELFSELNFKSFAKWV